MCSLIGVALFAVAFGFGVFRYEATYAPSEERQANGAHKVLTEGCDVTLKGKVIGKEKRAEGAMDGDFALKVATTEYGVINVVYSAFRACHNEVGASLKRGDRIEVYGRVLTKNRVSVCLSKSHYIKKL